MTRNFKIFLSLALAAFFVLGVVMVAAIRSIQINSGGGNIVNFNEEYLAARIAEELAMQQSKLFLETRAEFVAFDQTSLLGEFVVTALPLEHQEDSTAKLAIGGKSEVMQWKDGVLEGHIFLPLDTPLEDYRIALTSGGVTRNEVFAAYSSEFFLHGCDLFGSELSDGAGWGKGASNDEPYPVDMNFRYEGGLPFGDSAESIRIYAEEEGKVIYEKPMEGSTFNETRGFVFRPGVSIVFYAEAQGASGLTYRYLLQHMLYEDGEMWANSWSDDHPALRITTPEGDAVDVEI